MAEYSINKITLPNGDVVKLLDETSGYVKGVTVNGGSTVTNLNTNSAYDATSNKIATMADLGGAGYGTVTSVGLTNASGETDFTITGSPVTSAGTITIEHANSVTAKTTQELYPITFDKHGHITGSGNAVTIPTVNDGALKLQKNSDSATSIYTANQSGDTTVKFTTTSVGSASGWSAGTLPSLGTSISADDITAWTTNTPTTIDTTKFNGGSFTRGAFNGGSFTQGTDSFTANKPTTIDTTKFSGGSFTRGAFSGGSFTQGSDSFTANKPTVIDTTKFSGGSFTRGAFSGGSFTQGSDSMTASLASANATVSTPTTLTIGFSQGTDSFTAATHANDTFTSAALSTGFYSAGTSASFTQGTDSFTAATHANDTFTAAALATGFYSAGTSASFTQGSDSFTAATHANDTFTAASLSNGFYTAGSAASLSYSSKTIPNVTSVGTLPALTVTSTIVVNDISKLS